MDGGEKKPSGPAVFFPPRGYVPVDMFGSHFAWSVMIPGVAKLSKSQVKVRIQKLDAGYRKIADKIRIEHLSVQSAGGYPSCVIFRPDRILVKPGDKYWVELSLDAGRSYAIKYMVEFVPPLGKAAFRSSFPVGDKKAPGTDRD